MAANRGADLLQWEADPTPTARPEFGMKNGLLFALAFGSTTALCAAASPPPIDFAREIRPILAKNCFACHGTDEKHREGGLRLDLRDAAIKKLDDGKTAIVPGHAGKERTGPPDHGERRQTNACRRPTRTPRLRKNKSTC